MSAEGEGKDASAVRFSDSSDVVVAVVGGLEGDLGLAIKDT